MSYIEYYHRTIQQHETGLKFVLGGTGLGKTSSIRKVIKLPENQERKFIYLANRKQLVEGMGQDLDRENQSSQYVILHRDLDVVLNTLKRQRSAFYELLESAFFIEKVKRWNDSNLRRRIDLPTVRRSCKTLEEIITTQVVLPSIVEEQLQPHARIVLEAFKAALLGAGNKRDTSPDYQKLADHPIIQSLFPFVAFKRRPEIRLLIATIQKTFYGFFDGLKNINLTRMKKKDGGYIIFLDEFDFLENDLVGLICREPHVRNPFWVDELFYRAMKRHKLPLETYPIPGDIRERIKQINLIIDHDIIDQQGLHFPDINQFTSNISHQRPKRKGEKTRLSSVIFRTLHTISTDNLYLKETNRSFEIITSPNNLMDQTLHRALPFFEKVSLACELILLLFKELERGDDEVIYHELVRHCFQDTIFPEELALISQFSYPRRRMSEQSSLDALLESGYSLYDIHDLQQKTDEEEVEVRHYGMLTTPETLLENLALHNLVFGLSATADIQRHVHHFNINWLRQKLAKNWIEVDEEDKKIIHDLNKEKAQIRNNEIDLVVLDALNQEDIYQQRLFEFILAVEKDEDFGNETHEGHLKQRIQLFFSSLIWLGVNAKKDKNATCLLFLTTFRQIKLIFDRYPTPDENLFVVNRRDRDSNPWFDVYEILIQGQIFIIVFYNAQLGATVRQRPEAQSKFDALFWEGKPVIVVTQYLSAGNGVNLQYWSSPTKTEQKDFTYIGLLEAPYFYFSKPDNDLPYSDKIAALKENIWYQAKLYTENIITERRFKQILSTLDDPWEWNNRYLEHPDTSADALFNHMATFMQALGRIERIWGKMDDQTVLLSQSVHQHFYRFSNPEFDQTRQEREPIISHNLQRIFEKIHAERAPREREISRYKDGRLEGKNERSRQKILLLLNRLEGLRNGNGDREARKIWLHIRQEVLRHNFQDTQLRGYACVASSSYYHDATLHLTLQNEIIPARLVQHDTYNWHMNALYSVIKDNIVVRDYFLSQDYKLAFDPNCPSFFTPYCYQAILTGAIGEEAITALLQEEKISLEDVPDEVFELADLKVQDCPCYIDGKYYNEHTLERFTIPPEDPRSHPKLNEAHFKDSARHKVEKLRAYHGTPVKLVYINLISSHPRPYGCYNDDFEEVDFSTASIIIIQGALQRKHPNAYHKAFEYFLQDLQSLLAL
ncbi:hypothetical protein [Dictyobacter kobayashii]|uniref:Uncharacterized protein n=1 Tax=Dictyobacter kobayashii TaxID=2014872 RepID=A0A402APD9_9CHLR|nr:hypothetical protein [Dictyobacter kobayashii]GCE20914.1 hypothetical protein KDK_47140 [Dictyobacter kobayashii]